jgi:hypothetical protein
MISLKQQMIEVQQLRVCKPVLNRAMSNLRLAFRKEFQLL